MEALVQASSAAAGGVVSSTLLHPLDTLKTRLQAGQKRDDGDKPEDRPGAAIAEATRHIYESGGVPAFFAGVVPGALQSAIEKAVYFYSYTLLKQGAGLILGEVRTAANLVVGYCAEWCHLPITLPIEVVVKRIQTRDPSAKTTGIFAIISSIFRVRCVSSPLHRAPVASAHAQPPCRRRGSVVSTVALRRTWSCACAPPFNSPSTNSFEGWPTPWRHVCLHRDPFLSRC